jgi:hypothetical protein
MPTGRDQAGPARGYFTEVPVYAGVLHATAETLELLHEFFTNTDPAVRTSLGRFLIAHQPDDDTGDPGIQATILVNELTEVADLLRTIAGDNRDEAPP